MTKFVDMDVIDNATEPLNNSAWQELPFLLANLQAIPYIPMQFISV
jgi:hypothetical protein